MRILTFFLLLTSLSMAQLMPRIPFFSSIKNGYERLFFYEVINLISEDTSKGRIDINFRIANDILTFVKNPRGRPKFIADFYLSAEIFDEENNSVVHKVFHSSRATDDFDETNSRDIFTQGNFRFDLKPGKYRLILILEDNQSKRLLKREKKFEVKNFQTGELETSDLLLIQRITENGDTMFLIPTNIGNRVNFGKDFICYIQLTDKPIQISYSILLIKEFGRRDKIISGVIDTSEITNRKTFTFKQNPGDTIFTYILFNSAPQTYYSVILPIKSDSLDLGQYELELKVEYLDRRGNVKKKRFIRRFIVEWIDMPFSLRNLDYAIEMLRYIASGEELARLRFGTYQARLRKFKEFWKRRDPTPETVYNELMAEYYRRVDYANMHYSSIRERDGARTDRGKIYILYGEPTRIERKYIPGQPTREIWFYDSIGKKFIFIDEYGEFKLISVERYEI